MEKGTILVVEDEANIADLVDLYLTREGYRVLKQGTGAGALEAVRDHRPRLVVLDIGLPDIDGLEVCRRIRATGNLPVIFLTARGDEVDRVLGLELGADDYLTKPFSPAELVARVKAVLRRVDGVAPAEIVQAGRVTIDGGRREIRIDETAVDFTTKEFDLLRFLAERPGLALSRQQILDGVWGYDWFGDVRTVDVHIAQVRKKLGDACTITTVRGVGYRMDSSSPALDVTKKRRTLRTRLVLAMAGIAVGVLAITAVTTDGLARRSAANTAQQQLEDKAPQVAAQLEALGLRLRARQSRGTNARALSRLIVSTLRIADGGVVTVTPKGEVTDGVIGLSNVVFAQPKNAPLLQLPDGLSVGDLDTKALLAGEKQTGRGDGVVFVAQPLTSSASGTPVLLLTQEIDQNATRQARGFFLIAALVAVGLAIIVAVFLARRLTRPLKAMGETARSITSGDLAARVDLGNHPDDELADLAQTLNAMAAQLEHSRGMERAFILSVSHDLRTPLTSIRGYAEAMTDGAISTDAEQAHAARVITAEARRLERLVADLLDLARIDARQFSLAPRPIDAAETVRTAVDAFRPAATELGISMRVDGPESLAADTDPDRLAQIVANLVENALKYSTANIVVELAPYGTGDLDVRVRDDGPGIAPADLPQVFDRLYVSRTVPGRSVGTGIGLAIVRELAGAMGGHAWVDPTERAGATFVVRLPILRVPAPTP